MRFVRFQFALVLTLTALLCLPSGFAQATSPAQKSTTKHPSRRKAKPKKVSAPQPDPPAKAPGPLEPLKGEDSPALPPSVSYANGKLTILAQNSTLSDILRAVRGKTGVNFDIPAGANERVVGQMGPGPPRDVLASLLNGTHYNYVMLGTAADPNSVAQIVLTPRTGSEEPEPAPQANQPGMAHSGFQPGMQPGMAQQFPAGQAPAEESQAETTDEDDTSAQDTSTTTGTDEGAPEQAVQGGDGQNANQPNVKTPEQLLQELQRQQQIMQQQQQGQQAQPGQPQPLQPQVIYTNPQQQPQPPQQPQ